eukprot:SAG31_NODE_14920_length_780_cov_1.568282_1_plen_121_part_00
MNSAGSIPPQQWQGSVVPPQHLPPMQAQSMLPPQPPQPVQPLAPPPPLHPNTNPQQHRPQHFHQQQWQHAAAPLPQQYWPQQHPQHADGAGMMQALMLSQMQNMQLQAALEAKRQERRAL